MKNTESENDVLLKENQIFKDKLYKDLKGSAYLLGIDSPSDIIDWIDTGSTLLNLIISNRPDGGLPVGRIVSIAGNSGSGKSLLVAHLIANVQKRGGIAVLIESEAAVSPEFMQAVGVDLNSLIYINQNAVEDVFDTIEKIIEKVKKENANKLLAVFVDSLTALSTRAEKAADYELKGYGTERARLISLAFRKITMTIAKMRTLFVFTNQVRMNMDPTSYEEDIIPGGKAVEFYPSVIIKMKQRAKIKAKRDGVDEIIGVFAGINVPKNRMGPPFRKCNVPIYFDRGINDQESIFIELNDKKYLFIPKDASTCCVDFQYIFDNAPEEFKLNMYNQNDIDKLYKLAKDYDFFKKYQIPDGKKDKLAMINFDGNTFLSFSKSDWNKFYSVPEFKKFMIDFLSVKMQLKYMRHGMDENSIKIDENKSPDEEENIAN